MTSLLINSLLIIFGLAIGIKFADIDLAPVLRLRHRSIWTHGPLIVWLVLYLMPASPWLYWFSVGFLPAHAIHLLADMFPRNWKGGAMIKIDPINRQLAPVLSFAWLAWGVYVAGIQWLEITGHAWGWLA
jgi:hypothetical protein